MTPTIEPKIETRAVPQGGLAGKIILDLNTTGITKRSRVFDCRSLKRITLDFQLFSGTWGTAEVTLKRGIGGDNWLALAPSIVIGPGFSSQQQYSVDVEEIAELAFDVTTPEGAAGEAQIFVYGYNEPASGGSVAVNAPSTTNGRMVKVTGTTTGTSVTLHTAAADPVRNEWDEVDIYAANSNTSKATRTLYVEWGGTTSPDDIIPVEIPPQAGLVPVAVGRRLRGSLIIKAFASAANEVVCHVQANRVREGS